MADMDGDGIPDVVEDLTRVVLMEGSRVAEAWLRKHQETAREAAAEDRRAGQEASRRLAAEAALSRAKLAPVQDERWWERTTPQSVAGKYAEARAWDGVDESFRPYVEKIEEEAKAKFNLSPEDLLALKTPTTVDGKGEPARAAMSVDEARRVAVEAAPPWYKVHEALDREDITPMARMGESARLVEDMTVLREKGTLDNDSARDEWARFVRGDEVFREIRDGERMRDYLTARRDDVNDLWARTADARESLSAVPADPSPLGGASGREAGADGRSAGASDPLTRTDPMPVVTGEQAMADRREKRSREQVREASPREAWDTRRARYEREERLAENPDVSENLRAGIMAGDWSSAVKGGVIHPSKGGTGATHAVRNPTRGKGKDHGPEATR